MNNAVHIVLASDSNYLPGLDVTRSSILMSCTSPERLVWHVFDENALAGSVPAEWPVWNNSHMPYLRLWLPEILTDLDWVIYADVDTIWNRDICELWDSIEMAENVGKREFVYWVRDFVSTRGNAREWISRVANGEGIDFDWNRYACSGVCVLNLKKMRETGFTRRVLELFTKYGVPKYPDQDVLNVLLNSDCGLLPSVWNAMGDCSNLPPEGERCVYHITGIGRHFHDAEPLTYPPQYQLWRNVREKVEKVDGEWRVTARSRLLAALWPLHGLANVLPLKLRERIVRQWFFAHVLASWR